MEDKNVWDLTDIYANEKDFNDAVDKLYKTIDEIKKFQGNLAEGAEKIYDCYKTYEKAIEIDEKIYSYAMLNYHKDMSKTESIKLYKKVEKISTDLAEAVSFIEPEISKISDEKLQEYAENEKLQEFEKVIKDIIKGKKHILSEEVEKVISKYACRILPACVESSAMRSASVSVSSTWTPSRMRKPLPMAPTASPSTLTEALVTLVNTARINVISLTVAACHRRDAGDGGEPRHDDLQLRQIHHLHGEGGACHAVPQVPGGEGAHLGV